MKEVAATLSPAEYELFARLVVADQRHALHVLRRFDSLAPGAPLFARRAALLHDIGKVDCSLGVVMRVVTTVIGPRSEKMRRYHDHERIGVGLLVAIGSQAETIALLRGDGSVGHVGAGDRSLVDALRRADAI